VAACAAENNVEGPYLGVSWDGTGYGLDGTIWGGECFHVENNQYERVAHLRQFNLPGGDVAVREGWRSAASLLFEVSGETECGDSRPRLSGERSSPAGPPQLSVSKVRNMLERKINVFPTTSVGRLFDAVASITGVAQQNRFEGQAAMLLENEIGSLRTEEAYPLAGGDWAPLIVEVLRDKREGLPVSRIAARFHNALVNWILEVAAKSELKQVVLSGGVFQNRYLTERTAASLESQGFAVYTHRQVPPNDGGIALGQVVMA
jgi:hydrogenase maturation protein HypF